MPAPSAEPRVKGVAFRTIDACFIELKGEQARDRARSLMPLQLAECYRNGLVLASSWYPISWYRDVLGAYREAAREGPELVRQIGYRAMQLDMKSVYKQVFARFVSPHIMLSLSNRLFGTYYDTGSADIVEKSAGHVKLRFTNCFGWDGNMFTEIVGSSTALLDISGAREVRTFVRSGGRDQDTHMELEAYWV